MSDDAQLLRSYAEQGSEEAFSELVRRHLDLVYGAALRHVGDAHRAQDIAQSVFIDLARKARHLVGHPALISWLYTSTRYAALKSVRTEQRRQVRETEAQLMLDSNTSPLPPDWQRLRPILDEVLAQLGERDREILLLRYFRGQRFAEVSAAMDLSEGAARNRVSRALDKLSGLLAARGISSTSAALGVALANQPAFAAPASLAATVTSAALAGMAAGGGITTVFLMSKLKLLAAAVLLSGGLATAIIQGQTHRELTAALRADADDAVAVQADNRRLVAATRQAGERNPAITELAALRARIATLKARPDGAVDEAIRPPRNVGRATPAAAVETFCWAIQQHDLDLVASFLPLSDDSPENREAFMANFSDAVRTRYRTAERLYAAAKYGAVHPSTSDLAAAVQVISVAETAVPGRVNVQALVRTVSGLEAPFGVTYERRAEGWAERSILLTNPTVLKVVRERIDPTTGDFIPPKAAAAKRP